MSDQRCVMCSKPIDSEVMLPENQGPMHVHCWVSWMQSSERGHDGSCKIDECPDDATHKVVFNPVGQERRIEEYCKDHAELAAQDARDDPYGDLFLGPVAMEEDQ